jgi:hypothetical protein
MQNMHKIESTEMGFSAGMREGFAENAENSANSAFSRVHFVSSVKSHANISQREYRERQFQCRTSGLKSQVINWFERGWKN